MVSVRSDALDWSTMPLASPLIGYNYGITCDLHGRTQRRGRSASALGPPRTQLPNGWAAAPTPVRVAGEGM